MGKKQSEMSEIEYKRLELSLMVEFAPGDFAALMGQELPRNRAQEARDTRRRLKEAGLYPTKAEARQTGQPKGSMVAKLCNVAPNLAHDDLLALFVLAGTLAEWKDKPARQHTPSTITRQRHGQPRPRRR